MYPNNFPVFFPILTSQPQQQYFFVNPQQYQNEYQNFTMFLPEQNNFQIAQPQTNFLQSVQTSQMQRQATEQPNTENSDKLIVCNCANTKCQKDYCVCFKNGNKCGIKCQCVDCLNTHDRFQDPEVVRKKKENKCNCKKTKCIKKYCECYANGLKCGDQCNCSGCEN